MELELESCFKTAWNSVLEFSVSVLPYGYILKYLLDLKIGYIAWEIWNPEISATKGGNKQLAEK